MYFLEDASSETGSNAVASAARQVLFQLKLFDYYWSGKRSFCRLGISH